jgi:hypothetical protein
MDSGAILEPGDVEPPEMDPPEKVEFVERAYGWLAQVHLEVNQLSAKTGQLADSMVTGEFNELLDDIKTRAGHIDDTFEQAMAELNVQVPEEKKDLAIQRASARREAMTAFPLPPFPEAGEGE